MGLEEVPDSDASVRLSQLDSDGCSHCPRRSSAVRFLRCLANATCGGPDATCSLPASLSHCGPCRRAVGLQERCDGTVQVSARPLQPVTRQTERGRPTRVAYARPAAGSRLPVRRRDPVTRACTSLMSLVGHVGMDHLHTPKPSGGSAGLLNPTDGPTLRCSSNR